MNISKTCPVCGTTYVPELADDLEGMKMWRDSGYYAQDAFPHATSSQREQLISGICSNKCWTDLWGEEA